MCGRRGRVCMRCLMNLVRLVKFQMLGGVLYIPRKVLVHQHDCEGACAQEYAYVRHVVRLRVPSALDLRELRSPTAWTRAWENMHRSRTRATNSSPPPPPAPSRDGTINAIKPTRSRLDIGLRLRTLQLFTQERWRFWRGSHFVCCADVIAQ